MSNILFINSGSSPDISHKMVEAAREQLISSGLKFDEFVVPFPGDIPTSITHFLEAKNYEGILAIGCITPSNPDIGYGYLYQELIHQLTEFSAYYSFPMGIGVCLFNDGAKIADAIKLARDSAISVCGLIEIIRKTNSLDDEHYVRPTTHN
jgi:6,7-dimethyl-8-ribityllumazine synthase